MKKALLSVAMLAALVAPNYAGAMDKESKQARHERIAARAHRSGANQSALLKLAVILGLLDSTTGSIYGLHGMTTGGGVQLNMDTGRLSCAPDTGGAHLNPDTGLFEVWPDPPKSHISPVEAGRDNHMEYYNPNPGFINLEQEQEHNPSPCCNPYPRGKGYCLPGCKRELAPPKPPKEPAKARCNPGSRGYCLS